MKQIACPACRAKFDVTAYPAGKRFRCGKCKEILTVPEDAIPDLEMPEPEPEPEPEPVPEPEPEPAAEVEAAVTTTVKSPLPASRKPIARSAGKAGLKSARATAGVDLAPPKKSGAGKMIAAAVVVVALGGGGFFAWQRFGKGGGGSGDAPAGDGYAAKLKRFDKSSGMDHLRLAMWCRGVGHEKYEYHLLEAQKLSPSDSQVKAGMAELYWSRLAKKAPASAEECLALIPQAEMGGLDHEKKRLSRLAVTFDAKNEAAWKILGCISYGDSWLPEPEVKKRAAEDQARVAEEARVASLSPRDRKINDLRGNLAMEFGADFVFKDVKPYLICLQQGNYAADIRLEDFVKILEGFYKRFFEQFGAKFGLGDLSEEVMQIWIFRDKAAYYKYGESRGGFSPGTGGHWELDSERLMLFNEMDNPYSTIFHEATHMLIHFATKMKGKSMGNMLWFTEGIATYFEAFKRDKDGNIIQDMAYLNQERMPTIQWAAKSGHHVKLVEMLGKTYIDFSREMRNPRVKEEDRLRKGLIYYAEAWSIVYFFYNYGDGVYREKFETYFKEELDGSGGFEGFKKIFGDDIEKLEAQWLDFVKGLKA